jgi:hypothetical protein
MAFEEIKRAENDETQSVNKSGFVEVEIPRINNTIEGAEDIPSYVDQIVQNFGNRIEEQRDITGDWQRGELDASTGWTAFDDWAGDWNYNIQSAGKTGVGTVMDTIGVGIGAAIDGFALVVPDVVEDPIKEQIANSWDWLMNTEGGQDAAEAFYGTTDGYKKFKEEHPQAARTFEALVNMGIMFTPLKGRTKVGPVEGASITKQASRMTRISATKSEKKARYNALEKMLAPTVTKENVKQLGAGGESIINPSTLFRGPTLSATTAEREVIEHLVNMKQIKTWRSPSRAKLEVDKYQIKLNEQIGKILQQHSDIKIPIQSVEGKMKYNLAQALEGLPTLKSNKQILKTVEDYVASAQAILKKHPNTPQGVHNARIEFDLFMKNEVGKKVLTAEATGLNSLVAKEIRNAMNSSIDKVIPLKSIFVRRKKQNLNYRAIDMLAPKVATEGAGLFTLFQNLMRVNKARATAASAAVLTGGALYGSPALMWTLASMGTVVTSVGLGHLALKGALSPKTRRALATTLRETDKAIKITKNSDMRKSLRTSRVLVSDLLQMPTENVDAQGNPL